MAAPAAPTRSRRPCPSREATNEQQARCAAERQEKDRLFQSIFGFPLNEQEVAIDPTRDYGYAMISSLHPQVWRVSFGPFLYLYALFEIDAGILDRMASEEPDEDEEEEDVVNPPFMNFAFLQLNDEGQPAGLISNACLTPEMTRATSGGSVSGRTDIRRCIRDLTMVENPAAKKLTF